MEIILAVVIGTLYATSVYMMLRRSIVKLIIGLALLGQASNLLIFTLGRLTREGPPLVPDGELILLGTFADPVPQALILTAIVIGFGIQAFAVVLIKRVHQATGTNDLDKLTSTDR